MKKRHIYTIGCLALLALTSAFSCKKKEPTVEDNFLDYKIPDVPVTSNYTVGAFYYQFGSFNTNVTQKPTVGGPGPYFYSNGFPALGTATAPVLTPAIMDQHVADAQLAKIDYFIFSVRSPNLNNAGFKADSNTIVSFLNAANSSKTNFAVSYSLDIGLLGITNSGGTSGNGVTIESNATKLAAFYNDFKRLSYWMTKANYQKVNGKYLIVINNAQDLNSNNNAALYAQLRSNLSAMGFQLYIVGMQNRWSPPERYFYRFQNCTDAMYEANMSDYASDIDRFNLFPQMCDQNFAYWKTTVESWGQEFIPCVMAGYNYQIGNPTSSNLSVQRTADGAYYKTFTNVAKRNASKSRLIFVDSFNNFSVDSQIEPTQSYGTLYLDLTRTGFKVN
ncbi:glycoside hydrolase family 99-like domain-containing protein [Mucilaginibacter jinjuensis]|uniref:Glycoside hydrolase family 99-like domain-containing protein n=1 Tax=Mucilaginibacter jinjuensis TaxID=1176721 RepID=A0ABY7T2F2_9SPHI|nr:glycoside hydrolase family 99-like domain-containing protein [Mucilaginibacter jinjuensis]WCT10423.1 glycoside hydrolase family 99-like domain-containing protein [Mucilaginibacter jinjuensis]